MAVRIGLVGLGAMGGSHLAAFREMPDVEVAAVCDVDPGRLTDGRAVEANIDSGAGETARISDLQTYEDFSRMLRRADIDAVDICTPTYLHARMAVRALKRGRHVFCEKPLALKASDARKAVREAQAAGRLLMVGHVLRFWPEYLMLKEMLDSGRYGRLRGAKFWRWGGVPGWGSRGWFQQTRLSGNAAMDLHVHDTDTVLWLFGVPLKVRSRGTVTPDGGVDYIWTHYEYDSDAVIVSEGGWLPGKVPFAMGATLVFERACVDYHMLREPTVSVYPAGGPAEHPPVPAGRGYADELRYFIECVRDGRPPDRAPAREAALAVAVAEAEVRSVKTGRASPVP